jgi:hypothetical protein
MNTFSPKSIARRIDLRKIRGFGSSLSGLELAGRFTSSAASALERFRPLLVQADLCLSTALVVALSPQVRATALQATRRKLWPTQASEMATTVDAIKPDIA